MTREELVAPPDYVATLPNCFHAAADRFESRILMTHKGEQLSFRDAERRSAVLARRLLASGVGKGTRIGVLMPNSIEWVVTFLAITRIGAVAVLLSTLYQRRELAWVIRHADLHALFMADRFLSHDYVARLEEVAPDIRGQSSAAPLFLDAFPYLRAVHVWGDQVPPWGVDVRRSMSDEPPVDEELLKQVEASVVPADLALLIYTSGTTADPKGVLHTHGPVIRRTHATRSGRTYTSDSRVLVLGPFCWVAGLLTFFIGLHLGYRVVIPDTPKLEDVARAALENDVTELSAQPALIKQLREHMALHGLEPGPGLTTYFAGPRDENGEPVPANRQSRGLGMTETMAMHSFEPGGVMPPDKSGAFGRAVPDIERVIRDFDTKEDLPANQEGELWLRGPGMMQGMYKRERHEVFDVDGYYATGDICRIDEDGFIYFRGRNSEMIKTVGANVSPREVELALEAYPDVQEAGVFAMPGEGLDEIVAAVVAPRGDAKLDADELRRRLRQDISTFKAPKIIHIVPMEHLPRTGSGKLNKRAVKDTLLRGESLSPT